MNVHELNSDQMERLKQAIVDERNQAEGEGTSYGELANASDLVTDDEVFERYAGYEFGEEDF